MAPANSSTGRRPLCGSRSQRSPPAAALGPERASELSGAWRRRGRWGSGRREGGGTREGGGSGTFWSSLTGAREAGKGQRTAQCRGAAGRVRASRSGGKRTRSSPRPPSSVRLPPLPRVAALPAARPAGTMLLPQLCWLPLLAGLLPPAPAQKFSALTVSPGPVPASPPARAPRQSAGDPRGGGASARWRGQGRWVPGWYLACAPEPDGLPLRWAPGVLPPTPTPTRDPLPAWRTCSAAGGSWGPTAAGRRELGCAPRLAGEQGLARTQGLGTPAPPRGPSEAAPPRTRRPVPVTASPERVSPRALGACAGEVVGPPRAHRLGLALQETSRSAAGKSR